MEWLKTFLPESMYRMLLPMLMQTFGMQLQAKDSNRTGADDWIGQILVIASPAVTVALSGAPEAQNAEAMDRVMLGIRDSAQAYIEMREQQRRSDLGSMKASAFDPSGTGGANLSPTSQPFSASDAGSTSGGGAFGGAPRSEDQ